MKVVSETPQRSVHWLLSFLVASAAIAVVAVPVIGFLLDAVPA